ncbi:type II toxin-antitoxin system VapC family toxin [Enterovirga rhinocerotis]|uniref:PIN domain-containing protein n=1 Tax=Enterovirga rhinocerotis TaxID=1339210 RepID=A0A4R7CFY7_9HYPH|nr:type II toxin-antitoxin system VapC family toxin [Enterovirga rhinocerotis]TDR95903.1 hypothetical protein EV668_0017 [Enterovirga rhinocerotis]
MSALVVDASVAVKWFVQEDDSEDAVRILDSVDDLHAPRLLKLELANALWANVGRGVIGIDQAHEGILRIERTMSRWHDDESLILQAFDWSVSYRHPIYDFCYLSLALTLGLRVVTADRRFLRLLAGSPQANLVVSLTDIR